MEVRMSQEEFEKFLKWKEKEDAKHEERPDVTVEFRIRCKFCGNLSKGHTTAKHLKNVVMEVYNCNSCMGTLSNLPASEVASRALKLMTELRARVCKE